MLKAYQSRIDGKRKTQDARYSIQLEYCGHATAKQVLRFCGEWVGAYDSREEAEMAAGEHAERRMK